jgi:tRNA A-37 threonylcarbamoyl transferase component Bud32
MSDPEQQPAGPPVVKEISGRIGKYDIVRSIGKGAMGMVYLAHDTILERDVALKVMVSQIADDPELNQRFIREAKAVAKMTHPNVVNVFDLGHHTDGSPYIAMELLKGQDLQKALRTPPPLTLDRKATIIVQVLAGLAHAHQQGIVHRDIKPANVFLNMDGTVKIMDFGVARLTTASMTGTGNIVGTADYMSPEQVKGAKVDGRSDLFSVGCMLYELMAGRRPFHSDNLMAIFYKITHEEPNFELVPSGPEYQALMPILRKSLAKDLEDRYQTAYDFAVDLRDFLKNNATSVSGRHALEGLLDMEPPSTGSGVQPLTDVPGPTIVPGDAGRGPVTGQVSATGRGQAGTVKGPGTGTVKAGAPTVMGASAGSPTVLHPPPIPSARPRPAAPSSRPAGPPPEPSGNKGLYAVVGLLVVAVGALAAYVLLKPDKPPQRIVDVSPVPSLAPSVAPPLPSPVASATAAPVPSPIPSPSVMPSIKPEGKGAVYIKAADAAFRQGDYTRALSQAQRALQEDSDNPQAKRLLENALAGQKAEERFRAAEGHLRQNDFERALSEAEAGRVAAPWDSHGTDLLGRIQRAQQQAQAEKERLDRERKQGQMTAQMRAFQNEGDKALGERRWEAAIKAYEECLKLDDKNPSCSFGRTSALAGKGLEGSGQGGGNTQSAGTGFKQGATVATSLETKPGGGIPGFDADPKVKAEQGSTAAALPGKINFDVEPERVKPGERYTVKVYMVNTGTAPISLVGMLVSTKFNGKGVSQPVPPLAKEVAPQNKALILSTSELWKEEASSWSMEVSVSTARKERYTNILTWPSK